MPLSGYHIDWTGPDRFAIGCFSASDDLLFGWLILSLVDLIGRWIFIVGQFGLVG